MRTKLLLSAVLLAGLTGVAQAAFINIYEGATEGSVPTITYGGVTVVQESTGVEYAAGVVTLASLPGDGTGALNVLWQDPVTGLNSDFLHVEWIVQAGDLRVQWQAQSQPFNLEPTTHIDITRTETPGLMYLTPGDGLPDDLTIGLLSVVPEPTTMIAGAMLLLPFGASTLRILRKRQTA